jgi:GTPase SAR1 family protein
MKSKVSFDFVNCSFQVESFCATYNADVFVVVYSVEDRISFKAAEEILMYLWKGDYMSSRGVILVANKADLERKREVPMVGEYQSLLLYIMPHPSRGKEEQRQRA